MFSLFAGCEYVVIVTNTLFHGTAKLDFVDRKLTLVSGGPADWHIVPDSDVSAAEKKI